MASFQDATSLNTGNRSLRLRTIHPGPDPLGANATQLHASLGLNARGSGRRLKAQDMLTVLPSSNSLPPPNGSTTSGSVGSQNGVATGSNARAVVSAVPQPPNSAAQAPLSQLGSQVGGRRARPRNRNRNNNTGPQSTSGPLSPAGSHPTSAHSAGGRQRSQNNHQNRHSNQQSNIESAISPTTEAPISARAAKRRQAKARKAEARLQQGAQICQHQDTQVEGQTHLPRLDYQRNRQPRTGQSVSSHVVATQATIPHQPSGQTPQHVMLVPGSSTRPEVFRSDQGPQAVQANTSPLAFLQIPSSDALPAGNATHQTQSQDVLDPLSPLLASRPLPAPRTSASPLAPRSDNGRRAAVRSTARLSTTTRIATLPLDHPNSSPLAGPSVGTPASLTASSNPACSICLEVPDEFPQVRPTSSCTHPSTICGPCLEQHVSHAILTQGSTTLSCPDPECRQAIGYADVVRIARNNQACLDRYEALLLRRTLENEPNFVWCKNPTCNWGQLHESGATAPIVICQVCHARACFTHDVPWHTDLTCEQYTAQRNELETQNLASEAYINEHAKPCPNASCGRRIEKSHGCDHMTCRRPAGCGHEFCWVCLADYDPIRRDGNHRHRPTCTHYAAFDPSAPPGARFLRRREQVPPLSQAQTRVRVAELRPRRAPELVHDEFPPLPTTRVTPAAPAAPTQARVSTTSAARVTPAAPAASWPTYPIPSVPAATTSARASTASTSRVTSTISTTSTPARIHPLAHTSSAPSRPTHPILPVPATPARASTTPTARVTSAAPPTYASFYHSPTATNRTAPTVRVAPAASTPAVRVHPLASTPVVRVPPAVSIPAVRVPPTVSVPASRAPPAAPTPLIRSFPYPSSFSVSTALTAPSSWLSWLWG